LTKKNFFDIIILGGGNKMVLAFILWMIIVVRSWCDNLEKYRYEPTCRKIAVVCILLLTTPLLESVWITEFILNLTVGRGDDDEDSDDSSG
jgi:hypothetical protein